MTPIHIKFLPLPDLVKVKIIKCIKRISHFRCIFGCKITNFFLTTKQIRIFFKKNRISRYRRL